MGCPPRFGPGHIRRRRGLSTVVRTQPGACASLHGVPPGVAGDATGRGTDGIAGGVLGWRPGATLQPARPARRCRGRFRGLGGTAFTAGPLARRQRAVVGPVDRHRRTARSGSATGRHRPLEHPDPCRPATPERHRYRPCSAFRGDRNHHRGQAPAKGGSRRGARVSMCATPTNGYA